MQLACSLLMLLLLISSSVYARVTRFGLRRHDAISLALGAAERAALPEPAAPKTLDVLQPTHAGYLSVDATGRDIFHVFFEAEDPITPVEKTPIILWLQGGPGCSSLFGMLYINGPYFVQPDFSLKKNPGAWTRRFGVIYVDQPVGTGFSHPGKGPIPDNELDVALDMYKALQSFYKAHPAYHKRPLVVLGESYAGKYVPSVAHFILQADLLHRNASMNHMHHARPIPPDTEKPLFKLGAVGIGNGFTDARLQLSLQAQVAWGMGLIDSVQKEAVENLQDITLDLMLQGEWKKAREMSDLVMAFITNVSATQSLEDIRRDEAYDAADLASQYLNFKQVKQAIRADPATVYAACSPEVDAVMGPDVMRSTHHLVADLVHFTPLLLYQGQFDAECGYAANEAWVNRMAWEGHGGFTAASRQLWYNGSHPSPVLGYVKRHSYLTHVMVRNAGHMVPHDRPEAAQQMLESWLFDAMGVQHSNKWNLTDYELDTAQLPDNIWGPMHFDAAAAGGAAAAVAAQQMVV